MNYKESKLILEKIQRAKRILLNCHRGPDPDSIGCALAMYEILKRMGKKLEIVCPSEELYGGVSFLKNYERIRKNINFSKMDFSKHDLLICLDSSSWDMVSGNKELDTPEIFIVNIDHHKTNTNYGNINLVDKKSTSVGEMLYLIFQDWGIKINKDVATSLMSAIIGDTGAFRYPGSTFRTFEAARFLMKKGADKDEIIFHIFRSEPYSLVKFWGEALARMQFDKMGKFVWSAIPHEVYKKFRKPANAKETSASFFTQIVEGTEFGFMALEEEKGVLGISFRSRSGFDTSRIAKTFGGGGHIYASGAKVEGLSFDKAVEKVLKVARKYAKKNVGKSRSRN